MILKRFCWKASLTANKRRCYSFGIVIGTAPILRIAKMIPEVLDIYFWKFW